MKIPFIIPSPLTIQTEKIKKIPGILAANAFLIILIFMLANVIMGTILAYVYIISVQASPAQVTDGTSMFKYATYQRVLEQWQAREEALKEATSKKYTNPFTIQ